MANGAAVRLTLSEPREPHAAQLGKSGIDLEIGQAVTAAVCAIASAVDGYMRIGVLDPAIKDEGGSRIAKVVALQLDHDLGDDDFTHKARAAGRCVLRQHFTADRGSRDAVIDVWIDDLFTIVTRVVRDERIFRAAWAN